jgi:hypothetical protein
MKIISIFSILALAALSSACNIAGKKGEWSELSKETFMKSCTGEKSDMTPEELKAVCQCGMEKLQAKYDPKDLESKEAQDDAEKVGGECASGTKGNWSEYMKRSYKKGCMSAWTTESGMSEADFQKICDCSLSKAEADFSPMDLQSEDSTTQAKLEAIAVGCAEEVQASAAPATEE